MKVLVTGAGGQLGSDLVELLEGAGMDVVPFAATKLDITDGPVVASAVRKAAPSVIVNSAAYTKVDLAEKEVEKAFLVNSVGARNLAVAAAENGARLIHISTDFVFDGAKSTPYVETDPTAPLSVYGRSKLAGEEEVIRNAPDHAIIRTSWLYGLKGANFVKTILRLAAERETLKVVYDQVGTPTWSRDLASVIVEMIRRDSKIRGIYNYSNEGVASWYDFALAIVEEARERGAVLKCRSVEPIRTREYPTTAARPAYSVLDKERIKKALAIAIPHWRESLKAMLGGLYGGANA